MSKQIPQDEAVTYLRELLSMTRAEVIRECKFEHRVEGESMKKDAQVLHAFERKFDKNLRDPTIAMKLAKQRRDPFNGIPRK